MIGVIGLGLIGGSIAKSLNQNTDYTIYGYDSDEDVRNKATLVGAIEDVLTEEMIPICDTLIIALWPGDTVEFIKKYAHRIKKGAMVLDCCGVKRFVCDEVCPIAEENGFTFIGTHPMAGLEHSGFDHSKKGLFDRASVVLTPSKNVTMEQMQYVEDLCTSVGFTNVQITTPGVHDRMIAFTSQLAHVVSSAYIKSPTAECHEGFSAGSYKDLTRVAKLNEDMWTELFIENRENLVREIDGIIDRLREYSDAIGECRADELRELLRDGRLKKEKIDNEIF